MNNPISDLRELRAKGRESFDMANSYEDSVLVWVVGMTAAAMGLLANQDSGTLNSLVRAGFILFAVGISAGLLGRLAVRFLKRKEALRWVEQDSQLAALEAHAQVAMENQKPSDVVDVLGRAKAIGATRSKHLDALSRTSDG